MCTAEAAADRVPAPSATLCCNAGWMRSPNTNPGGEEGLTRLYFAHIQRIGHQVRVQAQGPGLQRLTVVVVLVALVHTHLQTRAGVRQRCKAARRPG